MLKQEFILNVWYLGQRAQLASSMLGRTEGEDVAFISFTSFINFGGHCVTADFDQWDSEDFKGQAVTTGSISLPAGVLNSRFPSHLYSTHMS